MTTATAELTGTHAAPRTKGPSLGRLTTVELRKMVDTRAGYWLLIIVALMAAGMVVLQLLTGNGAGRSLTGLFGGTLMPTSILLPVVGILSVTSEWSQRTAVTTFTLVPLRWRTLAAKLLAGIVLTALTVGACLATAAAGNAFVGPLAEGDGSWTLEAARVGYGFLYLLFGMLMGMAFGLAFMNTPLAIVLYFVVPTVWTILGQFVGALADARQWLDQSVTMVPLTTGQVTGQDWAQIAATAGLWMLLPLLVGLWRLTRREVS